MGCKVSKQGPASETSIEQKAAALGGTAAADTGAVCPISHYEATSDATSVASQYGSSAHTSQAGGGKSSTEGLTTLACPVTGATIALASSNNTDTDSAAAAAGSELPSTAGEDGEAPKLASEHKYNSFERPARSSLRTSIEQGRTSEPGSGGRRAVGFSIDENESVCPLNSRDSDTESVASHRTGASNLANSDSVSLKKIVDTFYKRVLQHDDLKPFFAHMSTSDMDKLRSHQVKFMALAFGGKELVNEEDPSLDLRKIHYRLIRDKGLGLDQWKTFVDLFEDVLRDLPAIPASTASQAMASIRATKNFFVPLGQEALVPKSIMDMPEIPLNDNDYDDEDGSQSL